MGTFRLARTTLVLALVLVQTQVHALSVITGSPCYDSCDGDIATVQSNIVCTDNDWLNTDAGNTLARCLTCLHGSSFRNAFITDANLFLYFLSNIQQSCLANSDATASCTSRCASLPRSFDNLGGRNQFQSPFSYCSANDNAYFNLAPSCVECLQSRPGGVMLGNVVYVGDLGCQTTPSIQDGDTINYSDDLFNTTLLASSLSAMASISANNRTMSTSTTSSTSAMTSASTISTTTPIRSNSTSHQPSTTSSDIPTSVTIVLTATLAFTPTLTASPSSSSSETAPASAVLSRGAAAGVGIALGLLGIAAIVALAIILRRRLMRRNTDFQRMSSPAMFQRSATPPAAGVYLPPGHINSAAAAAAAALGAFARTGIGKSIPKEPSIAEVEANEVLPKHSKSFRSITNRSFKSVTSRSWRSRNMTPRTSAWFYAANPKRSTDLTALPQPVIVPGVDGVPEVPPSRATPGRGWE